MINRAPNVSYAHNQSAATILNVNDEDAIRYVLSRTLKSAGFTVLEAATGRQGVDLAATRPNLILLDVQLPDIHGFRVCEMIKANEETAKIPVLMISANFVQPEDKVGGIKSGAAGYLTHPVNAAELIATVAALINPEQT